MTKDEVQMINDITGELATDMETLRTLPKGHKYITNSREHRLDITYKRGHNPTDWTIAITADMDGRWGVQTLICLLNDIHHDLQEGLYNEVDISFNIVTDYTPEDNSEFIISYYCRLSEQLEEIVLEEQAELKSLHDNLHGFITDSIFNHMDYLIMTYLTCYNNSIAMQVAGVDNKVTMNFRILGNRLTIALEVIDNLYVDNKLRINIMHWLNQEICGVHDAGAEGIATATGLSLLTWGHEDIRADLQTEDAQFNPMNLTVHIPLNIKQS